MTDESPQVARTQFDKRQVLLLLLAVVAIYVIVPQIGNFKHSLHLLSQANLSQLLAAVGCMVITYTAAAETYCLLAFYRLSYLRTLLIQIAGTFINRLLPAGIGGIGVNYAYLRKARHDPTEAASVVAANNLLGVVGHGLLLIIFLGVYHSNLSRLQLWRINNKTLIVCVTFVVLAVWLILYVRFGQRIQSSLRSFGRQLLAYRQRLGHLSAALLCSMGLTFFNALCFWLCALAVHADISFISVLLVFSFGVALGTATPTPGGLGGVEAGLTAGLIAYNLDSSTALAAVLLFRLITYWLPLLVGAGAFIFSQNQRYF